VLFLFSFIKKPDLIYWFDHNGQIVTKLNITDELQLIYLTFAQIVKSAWVFADSNHFAADQIYKRLSHMTEETIYYAEPFGIPSGEKFEISLKKDFITNKLPLIGDVYVFEGAFALLAYTYNIVCDQNKRFILSLVRQVTPIIQVNNVDRSLKGLPKLSQEFNKIYYDNV